ncbi:MULTISPECIES: peptide chain release factor N(5)-glutamine methyltransferase [Cupriavidus]|uniref:peptide chain release factor N(5)-glutamine methyltransferase n=1 Tax=Cupriavidus TaxID=106589 RepID=UPI00044E0A53|nr:MULTISPECIES: peptide chain release factor N(5)-glutamine methyltransferase [Cupriavidus]KDP83487.1 SAM-dependent methyltransferase [Cupriavidus sp. SK-3]MDF3881355.1 peptide chain release factor N(5)-glutamine methyltransferase [Cupriavidus basilensis]
MSSTQSNASSAAAGPHAATPVALPDVATVREVLAVAATAGLPALEARLLVSHVTGLSRTQLITRDNETLSPVQRESIAALLGRRLAGEPVAYLLGEREFFGRGFRVTPDVLIPRPDTEIAVEAALKLLAPLPAPRVLDMGTGSGALAVTLACERPDAEVWATDISPGALQVAEGNARALGAANVRFLASDWYAGLPGGLRFDLIVSNPPYIAAGDPHLAQGDLRFEPIDALTDHGDGLSDLAAIVAGARARLHAGGWLLMEHGYDQGQAARDLLAAAGMTEIFTARDLADHERCTGARLQPASGAGA